MSCKNKRDRCNLDPLRLAAARKMAENMDCKQKVRDMLAKKRVWGN